MINFSNIDVEYIHAKSLTCQADDSCNVAQVNH